MTWFGWFLLGLWAFSTLGTVAGVGKPRRPATSGQAVLTVAINAALIVALLTVGTGSL